MSDNHAGCGDCPSCHSKQAYPLFLGAGFDCPDELFQLITCENCELTRINPLISNEKLAAYYAADYYGMNAQQKFALPIEYLVRFTNHLRAKTLLSLLPAEMTSHPANTAILDIGCGRGNFLRALHRKGFDCYGTEIATFPLPTSAPRMTLKNGELQDLGLPLQSFAAISIWHVLEHTSDPELVIKQSAALLKTGGVLAIAVPNFGSYQRRLFGKHWFHLDLPRHLYHFNQQSLLLLLKQHGLQPVSIQTNSLDQNLFGFIQSTLNWLMPTKANLLFAVIKRKAFHYDNKISRMIYGGFSLLLGTCLLPVSLIENILSTIRGNGATLIVYAKK